MRQAAELAAAEVYEAVQKAAYEAARDAAARALSDVLGVEVARDSLMLDERVTQKEAAERLGTSPQTISRLIERGAVQAERESGRVYVRLRDVERALEGGKWSVTGARLRRATNASG